MTTNSVTVTLLIYKNVTPSDSVKTAIQPGEIPSEKLFAANHQYNQEIVTLTTPSHHALNDYIEIKAAMNSANLCLAHRKEGEKFEAYLNGWDLIYAIRDDHFCFLNPYDFIEIKQYSGDTTITTINVVILSLKMHRNPG